ncbi:virulence-associated E family protein [Polyangium sp. y55x31]|uniref:virulence-associated E family protein n=1 Tax=Polyangium sp. y55x31 TaxID=3042688 RepID=UPI002482F540|nr:virulence-associated E family protein [Polyangium sp. y55x31]MDI1475407.1 virulence-associated E family protein [Polyangium sp. y55x31]
MSPARNGEAPRWQDGIALTNSGGIKPTYGNLCLILRHVYGSRLAYNLMRAAPCIDERPFGDGDLGRLREDIERRFAVSFSAENLGMGVRQIAEERSFHPVRRYLEGLAWDGELRIARLLAEVFEVAETPLHCSYLLRWFVGCVARAIRPGCKLDTALVLLGEQGERKSTFFEILGGEWFADTAVDISTRQGLLQIAAAWIYEWAELERVTSKKAVSEVKAFLSSRKDVFVPPYGRGVVEHPRTTVIVGSTNENHILTDSTGSRRFWVLPVRRRLNFRVLEAWRDQLWAEAVAWYVSDHPWWLDDEEEAERAAEATAYEMEDAWFPLVEQWLRGFMRRHNPRDPEDAITTTRILSAAVDLEPCKQDKAAQLRTGAIMRALGYESGKMWIGEGEGRRNLRVWRLKAS